MAIAKDMQSLANDIIAGYDLRVKAVGDLVSDTRRTLKGFAVDRRRMGAEQSASLAQFVGDLSKNVGNMLSVFQKNHKDMSAEQSKSLADFVNSLTKGVGSLLKGFQKEHGEMSAELRAKLAKEVNDIEKYVNKRLKEFNAAHAEMSDELRKSLNAYVRDIESSVKAILSNAAGLVGEYHADSAKASRAWKSMSSALAGARAGGALPKVEAFEKTSTVKAAVKAGPRKTAKKKK